MASISRSRSRPVGKWTNGSYTKRRRTYFGAAKILTSDTTSASLDNGKVRDVANETCDDFISTSLPYPDQPLTIDKKKVKPSTVTGSWTTTTVQGSLTHVDDTSFVEFGPSRLTSSVFAPGARGIDIIHWRDKALANVNPLKPMVDLPLFLWELKDFPRMLRDIGRVLQKRVSPKDVPGGYLSYQFGWAPFLSDAAALIGLTEEIDARRRFFENLEDGRSINRTLLREVDVEDSSGYSELGLAWTERTTLSRRIWYSSRWRLSPEWTLPELAAESTSLGTLFGIGGPRTRGISASTIWNAIPWSWLIDYLTNFGTLLEANRGYAPLKLTSMCLMCQDDDRTVPVPTITPPGVVWDLGYLRRTVKRRFVVGVSSPMIRLTPFLTERQTTILGALALVTAIRRATS